MTAKQVIAALERAGFRSPLSAAVTSGCAVPEQAWQIAVDHRGEVRERRAEDACADTGCAHRRCWAEEPTWPS